MPGVYSEPKVTPRWGQDGFRMPRCRSRQQRLSLKGFRSSQPIGMRLAIKHPRGGGINTLTVRRSDTIRKVVEKFKKASGVSGSVRLRSGRREFRVTATLDEVGVCSGDTVNAQMRQEPRKQARSRLERGVTKRSTAHDELNRQEEHAAGSGRSRAQPPRANSSAATALHERRGGAARAINREPHFSAGVSPRPPPAPVPVPRACDIELVPPANVVVPVLEVPQADDTPAEWRVSRRGRASSALDATASAASVDSHVSETCQDSTRRTGDLAPPARFARLPPKAADILPAWMLKYEYM